MEEGDMIDETRCISAIDISNHRDGNLSWQKKISSIDQHQTQVAKFQTIVSGNSNNHKPAVSKSMAQIILPSPSIRSVPPDNYLGANVV